MYYTVIKDDSIWEHKGSVENTSRRRLFSTFLNCSWVFLRGGGKKKNHTFSLFYTLIKHGLLTNQSVCRVPPPLLCTTFVICCHFLRCLYQLKKKILLLHLSTTRVSLSEFTFQDQLYLFTIKRERLHTNKEIQLELIPLLIVGLGPKMSVVLSVVSITSSGKTGGENPQVESRHGKMTILLVNAWHKPRERNGLNCWQFLCCVK